MTVVRQENVVQTKLTLRLDRELIERAKAYARRTGKSVSEVVADFFAHLEARQGTDLTPRSPAVDSLVGALAGKKVSEADYRT
jgi:hypothetical protein